MLAKPWCDPTTDVGSPIRMSSGGDMPGVPVGQYRACVLRITWTGLTCALEEGEYINYVSKRSAACVRIMKNGCEKMYFPSRLIGPDNSNRAFSKYQTGPSFQPRNTCQPSVSVVLHNDLALRTNTPLEVFTINPCTRIREQKTLLRLVRYSPLARQVLSPSAHPFGIAYEERPEIKATNGLWLDVGICDFFPQLAPLFRREFPNGKKGSLYSGRHNTHSPSTQKIQSPVFGEERLSFGTGKGSYWSILCPKGPHNQCCRCILRDA